MGERQEAVNVQAGGLGDLLAGDGGGAEGVMGQNAAVGGAELYHQLFFVVMGDDGDIHGEDRLLSGQIFISGTRRPAMRLAMFS